MRLMNYLKCTGNILRVILSASMILEKGLWRALSTYHMIV